MCYDKFNNSNGGIFVNSTKRAAAALLSLLLLLTMLVACDTAGGDESSAVSANTSYAVEQGPLDHIETQDLDLVLNVLVEGDYRTTYASTEVLPHEKNASLLNEMIEERNNLLEAKLGVTLNEIRTSESSTMTDLLKNNHLSGSMLYDIAMPYFHDAAQLAPDGLFLNLYDYDEQIRFEADYWDNRCAEDVSVAGKLYFTTGDLSLLTFDCTHCLIFNKTLLKDLGIEENPYQLVKDGEWTIDKLHEMAKQATYDSDGVTGMTYKDTWGLFVNGNYATSLFVASGERLSRKNADDMPIITVDSENAVRVMDKIVSLFSDPSSTILIESFATEATAGGGSCWTEATRAVAEDRALFRSMAVIDLKDLEQYADVDYGILPSPKFSADQENYECYVSCLYASCITIPASTAASPEHIALALEVLNAASHETVKDAYYETILKKRSLKDDESEEVLDILFDNRVYDLGAIYGWGQTTGIYDPDSLTNFLNEIAKSGQNTFASKWESIKGKVEAGMQQTIDVFEAMG